MHTCHFYKSRVFKTKKWADFECFLLIYICNTEVQKRCYYISAFYTTADLKTLTEIWQMAVTTTTTYLLIGDQLHFLI